MEIEENSKERPSILIVDDNALIRNVIQGLLSEENFNVCVAANGREALTVLDESPVDVIVCDIMMPQMDGYQFFENVRSQSSRSHIPFIFLSALDAKSEVQKGQASGVDDYIVKPFCPDNLVSVIKGKVVRSRELKESSEEKYESFRKRVLHTLSHEFRTPLVAINTGTEMLLDEFKDPVDFKELQKAKKLLEAIYRGGQRLENLVNDFMVLQQIDAGIADSAYQGRAQFHSISSIVQNYLATMEVAWKNAGFTVRLNNVCPKEKVFVYEPHIIEVLRRIGLNCMKFSDTVKEIDIAVYRNEDDVVVAVADCGKGFGTYDMQDALKAFQQVNRERHEQQGGGLGLTIAGKYAEINHAHLAFDDRKGGGALVSLFLPRNEFVPIH